MYSDRLSIDFCKIFVQYHFFRDLVNIWTRKKGIKKKWHTLNGHDFRCHL